MFLSDVFEGLPTDMKFSTIYWNYPFHPTDKPNSLLSVLERAVRDHNYEGLHKLLNGLKGRLLKGGILLLGFSNTMGDWDLLKKTVSHYGYQQHVLAATT